MIQSLPCFLDLCLNVCSPSQVHWDVYTEVLEAAHPLHRGPTDHKRSVGPLLSLPEVHNQLFNFAHVQRETVVLGPCCSGAFPLHGTSRYGSVRFIFGRFSTGYCTWYLVPGTFLVPPRPGFQAIRTVTN